MRLRALASLLLLAACRESSLRAPQLAPKATVEPAPALNVEDTWLGRLEAPLTLYLATRADAGAGCKPLRFEPASPDRTRVTNALGELSLHGGALYPSGHASVGGSSFRLHGQSPGSLLINDYEAYFSLVDCEEQRSRPNPASIDLAARFWATPGPFFVPALNGREVICEAVEFPPPAMPQLFELNTEGVRGAYRVARAAEGMTVGLSQGAVRLDGDTMLVVHGSDSESFFVNGTRWFLSRGTCDAARALTKPVNLLQQEQLRRDAPNARWLSLRTEYFSFDPQNSNCARVAVEALNRGQGRVRIERGAGVEEHDYDLYPLSGALWFGPARGGDFRAQDRMRGSLAFVEPFQGGLRVGGAEWFEAEAVCLHARDGK